MRLITKVLISFIYSQIYKLALVHFTAFKSLLYSSKRKYAHHMNTGGHELGIRQLGSDSDKLEVIHTNAHKFHTSLNFKFPSWLVFAYINYRVHKIEKIGGIFQSIVD